MKVGEWGSSFMGVRLHSKGLLSDKLLVRLQLHSDLSVVW